MLCYYEHIVWRAKCMEKVFMECLDCVQTAARLHLYIDRELSTDEAEVEQRHLAACPKCKFRFRFDMSLKKLIHECCRIVHSSISLYTAVLRLALVVSSCYT